MMTIPGKTQRITADPTQLRQPHLGSITIGELAATIKPVFTRPHQNSLIHAFSLGFIYPIGLLHFHSALNSYLVPFSLSPSIFTQPHSIHAASPFSLGLSLFTWPVHFHSNLQPFLLGLIHFHSAPPFSLSHPFFTQPSSPRKAGNHMI